MGKYYSPEREVVCVRCGQGGGTLTKIDTGVYAHPPGKCPHKKRGTVVRLRRATAAEIQKVKESRDEKS